VIDISRYLDEYDIAEAKASKKIKYCKDISKGRKEVVIECIKHVLKHDELPSVKELKSARR